jgi:hypothetical protein
MRLFLPHVLYTVWCLSKSYAHNNNCKKQLVIKIKKTKKKERRENKRKHSSTDRD